MGWVDPTGGHLVTSMHGAGGKKGAGGRVHGTIPTVSY